MTNEPQYKITYQEVLDSNCTAWEYLEQNIDPKIIVELMKSGSFRLLDDKYVIERMDQLQQQLNDIANKIT